MSKIVDIADIYKLKKQAEEQGCTVGIYIDKGKSLGFSTDDLISFAKKGKTLYETDSPEIKNTIRTEAQKIYNDLRWNYILRGYEDELVKYWVAKQKAINPLKHFSM